MSSVKESNYLICLYIVGLLVSCSSEKIPKNQPAQTVNDPGGSLTVLIKCEHLPTMVKATLEGIDDPDKEIIELDECKVGRAKNQSFITLSMGRIGYTPPQHVSVKIFNQSSGCDSEGKLVFELNEYKVSDAAPAAYSDLKAEIDYEEGAL